MGKSIHSLYTKFTPSNPCTCEICRYFCIRPGWWLVEEAQKAIKDGLANRMMLEFSSDLSFAVLSPAFKGNEAYFALKSFSKNMCTFFIDDRCSIFSKEYQPIECRFCHHDRIGLGDKCHYEVSKDWNTSKGKRLIKYWLNLCNLQLPVSFHI